LIGADADDGGIELLELVDVLSVLADLSLSGAGERPRVEEQDDLLPAELGEGALLILGAEQGDVRGGLADL
jgi:hypothetical protein